MKNLWLIRHAKSSWGHVDLHDSFRPLNERGYRDAQEMCARIKKSGVSPDLFVSSFAIRAYSTAVIFAHGMKYPQGNIRLTEQFYESTAANYVKVIQALPDQAETIFLFGHNPTISQALELLAGLEHQELPTSGAAHIVFNKDSWAECAARSGKLVLLDYPKNGLD
ncbi:MAG TPA: histidine phosphatase family protein [Bacteroidia bacterium]|nr:histidine phosphatase family protein [Bacteroidia bacterium]